jgi:hypothetical protein
LNAVTDLALCLWRKTDPTASVSELKDQAARILEKLEEQSLEVEQAAHQLGSGTLLVRNEEGAFSFIHQSVLEWLVVRHAAQSLEKEPQPPALGERGMSALMADFFAALAGKDAAIG